MQSSTMTHPCQIINILRIPKIPNHEVLGKIAKQESAARPVGGVEDIATFPIFPKIPKIPAFPRHPIKTTGFMKSKPRFAFRFIIY